VAKRIKKPPIKAEVRSEWLRRHEENGDSPPKIAAEDGYDVRTVRKHIELAKEERESRAARAVVLRNALERHYEDLSRYAEMLDSKVSGIDYVKSIPDAEFIEVALRQHLPRSPIWRSLARLEGLKQASSEQIKKIESVVKKAVRADSGLTALAETGLKGVAAAVVTTLTYQASEWSRGSPVQDLKDSLFSEPAEGGRASLHLGQVPMGQAKKEDAERCKQTIGDFLKSLQSRLRESEEYYDFEKTVAEIERTRRKLREELAIIRLRRVVPGRCKFCPPW
jgi:hypothetical protein